MNYESGEVTENPDRTIFSAQYDSRRGLRFILGEKRCVTSAPAPENGFWSAIVLKPTPPVMALNHKDVVKQLRAGQFPSNTLSDKIRLPSPHLVVWNPPVTLAMMLRQTPSKTAHPNADRTRRLGLPTPRHCDGRRSP